MDQGAGDAVIRIAHGAAMFGLGSSISGLQLLKVDISFPQAVLFDSKTVIIFVLGSQSLVVHHLDTSSFLSFRYFVNKDTSAGTTRSLLSIRETRYSKTETNE